MKPYTDEQWDEDREELALFEKSFEESIGKMFVYKKHVSDITSKVCHPIQMYVLPISDQKEFRTKPVGGDLVRGLTVYIFISTNINPNGIDSTGRIGRTWDISFEAKGSVRAFKTKTWYRDSPLAKFYGYAESKEEILARFEQWYKISCPHEIKKRIANV